MTPSGPIPQKRLLCVDDHSDVTATVARMACEAPNPEFECVGQLASADELVQEVERLKSISRAPDVITLDVSMPGRDPLEALRELTAQCPDVKVVMYTVHETGPYVRDAVEAGAWGYVAKSGDPWEIVRALRMVVGGEMYFSSAVRL
jgi:two-component system, NarL family, invasion response regulator UvrY